MQVVGWINNKNLKLIQRDAVFVFFQLMTCIVSIKHDDSITLTQCLLL